MLNEHAGVVLEGAPLPPSSNHQYNSFMRYGKIVHVRSPELVKYRAAFARWAYTNAKGIEVARAMVEGCALEVELFLGFSKAKMFTKKGTFRKFDVSNRIKAAHDCLSTALGIDDSHFFSVTAEKFSVEHEQDEQCIIRIAPFLPRSIGDVCSLIL